MVSFPKFPIQNGSTNLTNIYSSFIFSFCTFLKKSFAIAQYFYYKLITYDDNSCFQIQFINTYENEIMHFENVLLPNVETFHLQKSDCVYDTVAVIPTNPIK